MDFEAILVSDFASGFVIAGPQIPLGSQGKEHHHQVFRPHPKGSVGH
jgi:hypothetical protein